MPLLIAVYLVSAATKTIRITIITTKIKFRFQKNHIFTLNVKIWFLQILFSEKHTCTTSRSRCKIAILYPSHLFLNRLFSVYFGTAYLPALKVPEEFLRRLEEFFKIS